MEVQESLDTINKQLQEKEKACNQEKENLSREITTLKRNITSTNAELQNVVSQKDELMAVQNNYKGTVLSQFEQKCHLYENFQHAKEHEVNKPRSLSSLAIVR